MHLLLEEKLRIGIQTIHRIGEPTAKPALLSGCPRPVCRTTLLHGNT